MSIRLFPPETKVALIPLSASLLANKFLLLLSFLQEFKLGYNTCNDTLLHNVDLRDVEHDEEEV